MQEKEKPEGTTKAVLNAIYALAAGLLAATLATLGPVLVAFVAAWTFNYLGWSWLRGIMAKIPSYFPFFIVFGVAVGLTTSLRILGRRFRKEPEPRSLK